MDTNVHISGYLWSGKPRQLIRNVSASPYEILYCRESLTELVRILSGKFNLAADEVIKARKLGLLPALRSPLNRTVLLAGKALLFHNGSFLPVN